MPSENVKTASELAEDARRTGHDALVAAQGYAQESRRIVGEATQAIRESVADAKDTGSEALDTVQGLSSDARELAKDAAKTGKSYAASALGATSAGVRKLGERVDQAKDSCAQYIAREPVKSTLFAMASGAAAMALVLHLLSGRRR